MNAYTSDKLTAITDAIVAALEKGTMPWRREWSSIGCAGPHNAITGRAYRGVNWWYLSIAGQAHGCDGWLTFNQARQAGGSVRKGEHGVQIVFWKPTKYAKVDEATGESKIAGSLIMKFYTVFNVRQCDGLKLPARESAPVVHAPTDMEAVYSALGAEVQHGGDRAFYSPAYDRICLPAVGAFSSVAAYKATAFHELTHWTAHKDRCDRNLSNRFGDAAYAAEELVAELGAAYLCAMTGTDSGLENHASYIASWIKVIREDSKAIITAASKAQAAADFIAKGAGLGAEEEDDAEEALAA